MTSKLGAHRNYKERIAHSSDQQCQMSPDTGVSTGFEKAEPSDGLVLTPDFQQNPQQLHDPSLSTICHCGSIGVLQNLTPEHLPACILSRDRRSSAMFAGEGRLPPSAPALPALQLYLHGHFCSGLLGAPLRGRQGSPVGRGD